MKTIRIIIEKNEDGYWGYAENESGITGGGETVQACKQDILDCIDTFKLMTAKNRPKFLLSSYQLVYRFDAESLLAYYKGIFTNSALERLTGINQKQLQHYATGHRKPRPNQREKIQAALHQLGSELLAVEL
ncbi:MAG: hypothetical protein ACOVOY_10015 [Sediminibacterium sp.]|jgi:predicted RNase H-like HicB family nuclease|nr:type II toxin-antitoxin system HicB family antitoxin [Chitinophagaceae bacterium]